jgi:hypothetical protein
MSRDELNVRDHISVSRMKRYAQCPRSYQLHYVEKQRATPSDSLVFGSLLHVPLEHTYKRIVAEGYSGKFPVDWLVAEFRREWMRAELSDFAVFDEGLRLLKDYATAVGFVDYRTVLGVEQEFRLTIGRFEVLGYLDRADKIDDETVLVTDYKSNRLIFSREDIDHDLQLGVYALAARELWPWAKRIRLAFYLLRHGFAMETIRSEADLESVREYVVAIGEQMETVAEFPARLNTNCTYCDHNTHCDAYTRARLGEVAIDGVNESDLESVARARQELAHTVKVLSARKDDLDDILKAHLKEHDALVLDGTRFSMFNVAKQIFPLRQTIDLVSDATGLSKPEVANRIAVIDKSALDELVKGVSKQLPRDRVDLLRAELSAASEKTMSQRLWAKEVN